MLTACPLQVVNAAFVTVGAAGALFNVTWIAAGEALEQAPFSAAT
jgi:hypothetical protein